jgi:hypothetical protein
MDAEKDEKCTKTVLGLLMGILMGILFAVKKHE